MYSGDVPAILSARKTYSFSEESNPSHIHHPSETRPLPQELLLSRSVLLCVLLRDIDEKCQCVIPACIPTFNKKLREEEEKKKES